MADTRDLKSLGVITVRVRAPPPAPKSRSARVGWARFFVTVGLEQDGGSQAAKNSPADCFLVRGLAAPPPAPKFSRSRVGSGEFFVTATLVNQTFTFVDSI